MEKPLAYASYYFVGVAGAGMSAIAQFLAGKGYNVYGSDRLFQQGVASQTRRQLEACGITCLPQTGQNIPPDTQVLVVSTAIEDSNPEVVYAKQHNLPILTRSSLLAMICEQCRTVAVAGTSGKSTSAAMLYHILESAGLSPSFISGAGLVSVIKQDKIGNCAVGKSDILIIEADESDGSLVKYKPEVGLLLSIDKDHKELNELHEIFGTFKNNTTTRFVVNRWHPLCIDYSVAASQDYGPGSAFEGKNFQQNGFEIQFEVNGVNFKIPSIGRHNMENACGAAAVAAYFGVSAAQSASALQNYEGIYRRHQLIGEAGGVLIVDDYAHNPAKIAASIKACQPLRHKLIAWFQPHGFGPTKFIRKELVEEICAALRPQDEVWMSEIYYAGGTVTRDISANDLISDLAQKGCTAKFVADRNNLVPALTNAVVPGKTTLLLMGARDPGLEKFAAEVAAAFKQHTA